MSYESPVSKYNERYTVSPYLLTLSHYSRQIITNSCIMLPFLHLLQPYVHYLDIYQKTGLCFVNNHIHSKIVVM